MEKTHAELRADGNALIAIGKAKIAKGKAMVAQADRDQRIARDFARLYPDKKKPKSKKTAKQKARVAQRLAAMKADYVPKPNEHD